MGRMLEGRRQNIVLATKFGSRVPKYTAVDVEISLTNSLQRLQTDYIDLYQARLSFQHQAAFLLLLVNRGCDTLFQCLLLGLF